MQTQIEVLSEILRESIASGQERPLYLSLRVFIAEQESIFAVVRGRLHAVRGFAEDLLLCKAWQKFEAEVRAVQTWEQFADLVYDWRGIRADAWLEIFQPKPSQ